MDPRRIQKQDILYELTLLDSCQKGVRHSDDELELLAERWYKIIIRSVQFVSKDVFHDAVVSFQASNPWFPTVQELIENIKTVWEERRRNIKALPEPDFVPPTPAEMAENRKRLDKIFKSIGEKVS